jgi:hypothetical protein
MNADGRECGGCINKRKDRRMDWLDEPYYTHAARPNSTDREHSDGLYRVVVPTQNVVVRLNGRWQDTPENEFLPAVRPYGILRMSWAIWREVPDVAPREAFSLALRVRRKGEAKVLLASGFLAEHVRLGLLARHHLASRIERDR